MKYQIRHFIFPLQIIFVGMATFNIQAQETVSSSGGNALGSGGSASYTIGQVAYTSNTSSAGTVSQGVQQPYEIIVITGIDNKGINLELLAYPNPTNDVLNLKIESELRDLNYQLFDVEGNLIQNQRLINAETIIEMKDLLPAIYFLKIYQKQIEVKSFKIVKY
jgi:hypothetical protein